MISVWIVHIYSFNWVMFFRKMSKKGHFRSKDIKIVKPKRV